MPLNVKSASAAGSAAYRQSDAYIVEVNKTYAAYAAYVAADGGTITTPNAVVDAIAKAAGGDYAHCFYAGAGSAVSPQFGIKTSVQNGTTYITKFYSLFGGTDVSAVQSLPILNTTARAFPTASGGFLGLPGFPVRPQERDFFGAVLYDAAPNRNAGMMLYGANNQGIYWDVVGALLQFFNGAGTPDKLPLAPVPVDSISGFLIDWTSPWAAMAVDGASPTYMIDGFPAPAPAGTIDLTLAGAGGTNFSELWISGKFTRRGWLQCQLDAKSRVRA